MFLENGRVDPGGVTGLSGEDGTGGIQDGGVRKELGSTKVSRGADALEDRGKSRKRRGVGVRAEESKQFK